MFERYNQKARRTIFVARDEAGQFCCCQIETEHLLPKPARWTSAGCSAEVKARPRQIAVEDVLWAVEKLAPSVIEAGA